MKLYWMLTTLEVSIKMWNKELAPLIISGLIVVIGINVWAAHRDYKWFNSNPNYSVGY